MSNKFARKAMVFVFTMAMTCSVFMGSPIEGYATSVSGNEVTTQESSNTNAATVSGNEVNVPVEDNTTEEQNSQVALASEDEISTVSGNEIESNYNGVLDLKWAETGVMSFVINDSEAAIYSINLERDGNTIMSWDLGDVSSYFGIGEACTVEAYDSFEESGTYRFRVKVSATEDERWNFKSGCVSEYSPEYVYTLPSTKLASPQNVRWSPTEAGVVEWDAVEGAYEYNGRLKDKDGTPIIGYNRSSVRMDFSSRIGDNGPYTVMLRAISSDIENVTHSDWVSCEYVDLDTVVEETNATLDGSLNDMSNATDAASAQTVVSSLQASIADSKNDLQVSMQSNSETRDKIQNLEDAYKTKANITQTTTVDESLMDPSKISILGSALNATPNASVNFNISKATEEDKALINTDLYKSVLAFEMGLEGDGINSSDLAIPVCITLPIPEGMNASNLRILHYSTAGADPVIYGGSDIRINGDGTFSFTITHFSLFAIVESEETQNNVSSDSGSVVYSSGKGGSSQRYGVMGWTPTTPDEKKRYALMGKEPVEYIPAVTNSYDLTVRNSMQGPKCVDSFEAVLGDYTIGRTYSIYPVKNKVSSMDQAAKLTLTIPKALRTDGRTFKMICVTEDGTPYILNDLDKDPNTITFETNKFYAFALIYK